MFNQTLKFSWAHILAFLALMCLGYGIFMSVVYYTGGDMILGGSIAGGAIFLLGGLLYTIQLLKASESKFGKRLNQERFMVCVMILCSIAAFALYAHFWTIYSKSDVIKQSFQSSISNAQRLFAKYDDYVSHRRKEQDLYLDTLIKSSNKQERVQNFVYTGELLEEQKKTMMQASEYRLLSSNYTNLRDEAKVWLQRYDEGASVFNVFLMGDLGMLQKACQSWYDTLYDYSNRRLCGEVGLSSLSTFKSDAPKQMEVSLDKMRSIYSIYEAPNAWAYLSALFLFALMIIPYHMQERHTKARNYYGFWQGKKQEVESSGSLTINQDGNTAKGEKKQNVDTYRQGGLTL